MAQQQQQQSTSQESSETTKQASTEEQSQATAREGETSQSSLNEMQDSSGNQAALETMRGEQAGGPEQSQTQETQQSNGDQDGGGSAMVMASAGAGEFAFDNSFTPGLLEYWSRHPEAPLDDVLRAMADETMEVSSKEQPVHHPDLVSVGSGAAGKESDGENQKAAYLVANQNYTGISKLKTPIAETGALAGALSSRNYITMIDEDVSASTIRDDFNAGLDHATAGDEVVLGYAGHGGNDGLIGIDHGNPNPDVLPYGELTGLVSKATGAGVHLRVIMDSCHSAEGTNLVREEFGNDEFEGTGLKGYFYEKIFDMCMSNQEALSLLQSEMHEDQKEAVLAKREETLRGEVDRYYADRKALDEYTKKSKGENTDNADYQRRADEHIAETDRSLGVWWADICKRWDAIDRKSLGDTWDAPFKHKIDEMWESIYLELYVASNLLGVESPDRAVSDHRTLGKELDLLQTLQQAAIDKAKE